MPGPTRREFVAAAGAGAAIAATPAGAGAPSPNLVAEDLARYISFGIKASGGPGDRATGAWLQSALETAGFAVERLPFTAPFFDVTRAELKVGGTVAALIPQAIVQATPPEGIVGRLVKIAPGDAHGSLAGAIALVDLPAQRWSSALAKPIRDTVTAAIMAGAGGVILITNGPTHKALALNADSRKPMFSRPVAVLAPDQAPPFLAAAAAGHDATFVQTGTGGNRSAFNITGRIDRGRKGWIVVSTPRSAWFGAAGERGGGVAAWLSLARWAPEALDRFNLAFVCNSGHEYEYLGAEQALQSALPSPAQTALWVHLGANVAARDWHDLTGELLPLPSADPQRYLVATPALVETAKRAFAGQPGLEAVYASTGFTAGELTNVLSKGYTSVLGIFGAHRFHHAREDEGSCIDEAATQRVIVSLKGLLGSV